MRYLKIFVLLVALNTGSWIIPQEVSAQHGSVSYQLFYDELSPYGMWVDYPNYGYVWIPNGDPGFSPYATAGYWVFTDDGWTWVSDYPWGWATFHYGRWDYDDVYGWFWVPDDEWGPAWVSWRRSPGYYGWAPLRPGISITIAFGAEYHERNERWVFVRDRDITRSDIARHYVNRTNNVTIINNSTVIVNTRKDDKRNATYITGPNRDDVQKVTHTTVKSIAIRENDQPAYHINNGELQIYRPQVQKRSGNGQAPAPSKVMKLNDVKPAAERNAGIRQRDVNPANSRGKEQQPQNVAPPVKSQPPQPRNVNPTNSRGKKQQPQNVAPPVKRQPPQPRNVNPTNSRGKEQQPQNVAPPVKSQPPQPRNVNRSNSRGKVKQPQNVAPPDKNRESQPSQPRTNQDEKGKRKPDL